jgi:hypothetical protein
VIGYCGDQCWEGVLTAMYRMMAEVNDTRLDPVNGVLYLREDANASLELNDLLVTITSARLPEQGYKEITSVFANHASISNPTVGSLVLANIKRSQPVK